MVELGMENGGGEGARCPAHTIKCAFIRTVEAESDKNQENPEKTWRRTATQQRKTSLAHHFESLNLLVGGDLILSGGVRGRGGRGVVCYRLASAAKSPLSVNISCI